MVRHPNTDWRPDNLPVVSVGELAQTLKRYIEQGFEFVRVRGEISGCKRAASGHVYFSLKDSEACLDAVCWRTAATRLTTQACDGLDVIATGRMTTYPDRSRYQLVVDRLELAGEGALLKLLEERRRRLGEEGLFDASRKRPLPFLPEVIGVVTSLTGAVIRDILHRLQDRFPRRVLVWPVLVQGGEAAAQIAAAIEGFDRLSAGARPPRPDVLIVARGGGSLEDLWAFNEEIVVRAAARCSIPIISAVGHETDTTLIDFAADVRAPTPTAAAEMAVPVRIELAERLLGLRSRLVNGVSRTTEEKRGRLLAAVRGLPKPQVLLAIARQRLDDRNERLRRGLDVGIERRRQRLAQSASRLVPPTARLMHAAARLAAERRALEAGLRAFFAARQNHLQRAAGLLESFSYQRVLERGFAMIDDDKGRLVTSIAGLRAGMRVFVRLSDGTAPAVIEGARATLRRARNEDSGQGTLL
jgi:exodeoxyribonuclease VII large subunit